MNNVTDTYKLYDNSRARATPWMLAEALLSLVNGTVNVSLDMGGGSSEQRESGTGQEVSTMRYEHHIPSYPAATLITLCVVLGCMIVATVLGNVFVITAILVERSLQGVSNYLVLSLAVTDLLVAVLVMPLSLLNEVSVYWYLGRALCDMWISMDVLCCTASILHLVAIAIDRFWAVSNIDYIRRRCARQILLMIVVVWLVSVAISISPLFGWRHESDNPELSGSCMISQDRGYTIFSTVGAFYCPLVLMLVLNFKIYRAARYRIRRKGFMQGARHAHVPVPAVRVLEDTAARANNKNSSGSDLSQDGISMYNPSCVVNYELSHIDTGLDSNTGEYEQQYSYYPGESTTDSNPPDSYYPLDTEDPDLPPLSPSFLLDPPSSHSASEADERLYVDSGPDWGNSCLSSDRRTLSANHLTVPSCSSHLTVPGRIQLSVPEINYQSSCDNDSLSRHLAVPESSEIEEAEVVQITVPESDLTPTGESRLVQFNSRVQVEGDPEVSETSNSLKTGKEDEELTSSEQNLEEEGRTKERRNSADEPATICCANNLLSVEFSCVSNGHHRNHVTVEEPPAVQIRKDSCSQFMSESRCLNTPSFHSISSPSTTTTTTSGTCGGQGNQLAVPQMGRIPAQQPSKSRANNNTKRARNREKEKQRREKLEMRRERKAARVLAIITGAFVLCWLPFFILALVGPFLPAGYDEPPVLISLFLWLGYFNSLLNPVIYTVFNPSFRGAFRKIFFRRLRSVTR